MSFDAFESVESSEVEMVSSCCAASAVAETLDIHPDGSSGICSDCKEGATFVPQDSHGLTVHQREWIDSARDLIDFLEANPKAMGTSLSTYHFLQHHTENAKAEMADAVRVLGKCEKGVSGNDFNLRRYFGPHSILFQWHREQVCERVKVGTTVEKVAKLPEGVTYQYEDKVVDKYEWKCPESILAVEA